jgi:Fe-S cluster assembly iron-binding protein IscA
MLQLTPAAANHLNDLLSANVASAQAAVRIFRDTAGKLQLRADVPNSEDVGFDYHGRTVLILDRQMSETLEKCVLDVASTPQGQALSLRG